jgi:hypothetical protein
MDDLLMFLGLTAVAAASCGLAHGVARMFLSGLLRVMAVAEVEDPSRRS